MTLGFDFHPEARAEFVADVDWYDERETSVGGRFEAAVRATIDAAVDSPESWARRAGWEREPVVRSKGVSDFPYRVVYFVEGDLALSAVVVARSTTSDLPLRRRVARTADVDLCLRSPAGQ